MWIQSQLTWADTAQSIQTSAERVTTQIGTVMNSAVGRLTPLTGEANFSRHPLSSAAENLLGLRTDLEQLLTQGQVLTASPYQFQVGDKQVSGDYFNPQTAINTLVNKLNDQVDKNRPAGALYCIAIMVSEQQLKQFAETLTVLTSVFPLPDWCQVARQATALSTNSVDKLFQPAAIIQPRFKPQANLHTNPLREVLRYQGALIATLESLANDKSNVHSKLQLLANKRADKLTEISTLINNLKNLNGNVWSKKLAGTAQSIASQLKQASIPTNNQHTVASLIISLQPLTFFEELL